MAPSPENDNAPKAPDKGDKSKGESTTTAPDPRTQDLEYSASGPENKEASVSRLDDVELKALLDEAINYKTPKDRVGKSKLFQNLLDKAEEDDRKARATSASGSESVRYYNTTATHRTRRRREPSSISENLTHGGSLNNLAKEDLYAVASHLNRPPKTVSARQRQGGSLPCNVNAGVTVSYDKQFFEDARRNVENKKVGYTTIDMESESLLEHDSLNQNYNEQAEVEVAKTVIPRPAMKYTSRINLEIGGGSASGGNSSNVDDSLTIPALERNTDEVPNTEASHKPTEPISMPSHFSAGTPCVMPKQWVSSYPHRRVDENGNALDGKKNKKKKQTDKNVVVLAAKDVAGHRSDIINDLDKLVEFIGGNEEQTGAKSKCSMHKTKFNKHHFGSSDDKGTNKKQRTRSKGKTEKLQKSNSMEEISISKLKEFNFSQECDGNKVPLRSTKSNTDRPRERRSWGNSESLPLHASAENLETADFRVVTKKKKSKKRRNSVSGRRQPYPHDIQDSEFNRIPSPEPRRKSACSAPHSDKSNDSSDIDSIHSLPIDTDRLSIDGDRLNVTNLNLPISYADIAKTSNSLERPKWNRPPSERKGQQKGFSLEKGGSDKNFTVPLDPTENKVDIYQQHQEKCAEKTQPVKPKTHSTATQSVQTSPNLQTVVQITTEKVSPEAAYTFTKNSPPDVHNIQNWPAIQNTGNNNNNNNNNVKNVAAPLAATNKNNQKTVHNKNSPPINVKNNLKNVQLHKSDKGHQQHQQQQQQYIPNLVHRSTNSLPNNIHVDATVQILQNTEQMCVNNVQVLPHNIPDVQTIEKMHFKQLQSMQQQQLNANPAYMSHAVHEIMANHVTHIPQAYLQGFGNVSPSVHHEQQSGGNRVQQCVPMNPVQTITVDNCDNERTSSRPAVVILSGDSKEVAGITFGFDINEQLLSDDVCDNFTARFYVPDNFQNHNHDKIVNFIGLAWEDTINQANGKVQYFSDQL